MNVEDHADWKLPFFLPTWTTKETPLIFLGFGRGRKAFYLGQEPGISPLLEFVAEISVL